MTLDALPNSYGVPTVCFDFDGTLNDDSRVFEPGEPRADMLRLLHRLHDDGWFVVVTSARPPSNYRVVTGWLQRNGVPVDHVALGSKPSCDVYVDDKGLLPPIDALHEFIELRLHRTDQATAWARGLTRTEFARQMADCHENPTWTGVDDDDRFVVVVPMSAGMDSTTCWAMAVQAGLPVLPVHVDTGAPYSAAEIDSVRHIMGNAGENPDALTVLDVDVDYVRFDYVDLARNAIIIGLLAEQLTSRDQWGELWFGNTGEWQETPITGGDKSCRFFATMQHLLTISGHDTRIVNPIGALNKRDLVHWWANRGRLDEFLQTRSCYAADEGHCGTCRSCFRRWLAFVGAGYREQVEATYRRIDFDGHVAEYLEARRSSKSRTMSAGRVGWVDGALLSAGYAIGV